MVEFVGIFVYFFIALALAGILLGVAFIFATKKADPEKSLLMHSDQGWQYQMKQYQSILKQNGIKQSMSRKGNCLDNAVMENFFGTLKSELFYLNKYDSIDHLKKEINGYIKYYNHDRIKLNLNGMSPVQYRAHHLKT